MAIQGPTSATTMKLVVDNTVPDIRCSFCNRKKENVPKKRLAAGKEGLICLDCIKQAQGMVDE